MTTATTAARHYGLTANRIAPHRPAAMRSTRLRAKWRLRKLAGASSRARAQGIGALALASLLPREVRGAEAIGGLPGLPHFAPKAKRCIYLHLVGAPPQMETFDYKPKMKELFDKDLPESIRNGQRLTTMTSGQTRFPIAPSIFQFAQHGKAGAWVSELLPYTARMVDDIAIIRSMHTEAINHEPAITFFQSGLMVAGRPCIGSWLSYGLGSMNQNLPAFVVLQAKHNHPKANVQAISARLWSAGFLSGQYSGVSLRSAGDPVLFINNPEGVPAEVRRRMLDSLSEMNRVQLERLGDPETRTRIAQYEMAFRMQASVPELTDTSEGAREHLEDVRRGRAQSGFVRPELSDGAPPGGARRALRTGVPPRLGRPRQPAGGAARASARKSTRRAGHWCRISNSAECWTTRW